MDNKLEGAVADYIADQLGDDYRNARLRRSGAGCINETWEVYGKGICSLFVKIGRKGFHVMYQREFEALKAMQKAIHFHVPDPLLVGELDEECAILAMEFIPLSPVRRGSETALGEALAEMHGITSDYYGLAEDNFIGRSLQPNGWSDNWWAFFCTNRLQHQLDMAVANGLYHELAERIAKIIELTPTKFASHQPSRSLLHGDLWSGNVGADKHGKPVIYDPAMYYGDPETDIAMSQMFGALGQAVYEAYYSNISSADGVELRRPLYDLYHWLNHFNLFGSTYQAQVERVVVQLAEIVEF